MNYLTTYAIHFILFPNYVEDSNIQYWAPYLSIYVHSSSRSRRSEKHEQNFKVSDSSK